MFVNNLTDDEELILDDLDLDILWHEDKLAALRTERSMLLQRAADCADQVTS